MLLDLERTMEEVVVYASSLLSAASAAAVEGGGEGGGTVIHQRAHILQKLLHRHHERETSEVIFSGVGRVCDIHWLRSKLDVWKEDTLFDVCYRLRLVDSRWR